MVEKFIGLMFFCFFRWSGKVGIFGGTLYLVTAKGLWSTDEIERNTTIKALQDLPQSAGLSVSSGSNVFFFARLSIFWFVYCYFFYLNRAKKYRIALWECVTYRYSVICIV